MQTSSKQFSKIIKQEYMQKTSTKLLQRHCKLAKSATEAQNKCTILIKMYAMMTQHIWQKRN